MLEILFLFGFTLHNLEEALWLPAWSRHAARFHPEVKRNEFHFAIFVVTAIGYLLTFLHLTADGNNLIVQSIYYGFVLMMCLNVVFPHLIATIVLKRYAPGLVTGLLLNLPFGIVLIQKGLAAGIPLEHIAAAAILAVVLFLSLIKSLFKLGGMLIDPY